MMLMLMLNINVADADFQGKRKPDYCAKFSNHKLNFFGHIRITDYVFRDCMGTGRTDQILFCYDVYSLLVQKKK